MFSHFIVLDCVSPPIIPNAIPNANDREQFNTNVTVICDAGYEISGNTIDIITCLADGNWSTPPICIKIRKISAFLYTTCFKDIRRTHEDPLIDAVLIF